MTDTILPAPVVFDASAYRALAATGDAAAARAVAGHLAATERARGLHGAASPFVLWELLAAAAPRAAAAARPAEPAGPARDAVARAALAVVVTHCALDAGGRESADVPTAPGQPARRFALAPDPDAALVEAVVGAVPADLPPWSEYLASLAAEVADDPTPGRVAQLAGPLRHVRGRARQAAEDFADEVQDAVAAAYDAAAPAWDPSADSDVRQRSLAAGVGPGAGAPDAGAPGAGIGLDAGVGAGALLDEVLARDPLLRAVAVGRARRARRLAAGTSAHGALHDDVVDDALLADAARVVARFPVGTAVLRELLRRVIAGELDLAARAGRRWFWDAQVAFAAGDAAVSGSAVVTAARADGAAVRTLAEHVARLGAR